LVLPDRAKPQFDYNIYASKGVSSKLLAEIGVVDLNRKYIASNLNQQQADALNKYARGYNRRADGKIEIYTSGTGIPGDVIRKIGVSLKEETGRQRTAPLTDEMVTKLKGNPGIDSLVKIITPKGARGVNVFPQSLDYSWSHDQFGPIYIPEEGKTIALNLNVLPFYRKIIEDYEGNEIKVVGNQINLNGQPTSQYTFKQDYYWMMGDNRDHSEDSRAWGYVPASHIVGTPIFIWMSVDNFMNAKGTGTNPPWKWKPRWDRIFTTVNGTGEPVSYFKYFLIALAGWFAFDFFRKKRQNKS